MKAKDFLNEYLEYKSLWCFEHCIKSKPAKIRLNRLNSMLNALKIANEPFDLSYFEQGNFLKDREIEENYELIEKIQNLVEEKTSSDYEVRKGKFSIAWLFKDLLRFRKEIYDVVQPWSGFGAGFNNVLYFGKIHQENLKKLIRENTDEIDEILCLIIDPQKKVISEKELIEKYNYEVADLDEIDRVWEVENY